MENSITVTTHELRLVSCIKKHYSPHIESLSSHFKLSHSSASSAGCLSQQRLTRVCFNCLHGKHAHAVLKLRDIIRKCIINTLSSCKIVTIPVVTNVLALLTPKSVPARKEATQTVRSAILEGDFAENTVAERSKVSRRT